MNPIKLCKYLAINSQAAGLYLAVNALTADRRQNSAKIRALLALLTCLHFLLLIANNVNHLGLICDYLYC